MTFRTFAIFALWLFAVGCSGSRFESTVSGVVTLDGKRIGPGVVIFAPVGGTTNPAQGAIQPDGSYELKTSRDLGLAPGKYLVSLQIVELPTDVTPGQRDMRPTKSRIPEKYTDTTTSGLEYEVALGKSTIDIDLTSK